MAPLHASAPLPAALRSSPFVSRSVPVAIPSVGSSPSPAQPLYRPFTGLTRALRASPLIFAPPTPRLVCHPVVNSWHCRPSLLTSLLPAVSTGSQTPCPSSSFGSLRTLERYRLRWCCRPAPWVGGRQLPAFHRLPQLAPIWAWAGVALPSPLVPHVAEDDRPVVHPGFAEYAEFVAPLHANCLRAAGRAGETVVQSLPWRRNRLQRLLFDAAYDRAVASGTDGLAAADWTWPEVRDDGQLLTRAGERAAAKRMEFARISYEAGVAASPVAIRALVDRVVQFLDPDGGITVPQLVDLEKYQDLPLAVSGIKTASLAQAQVGAWLEVAVQLLDAHSQLARAVVASDIDGSSSPLIVALRERVSALTADVLHRNAFVRWIPMTYTPAEGLARQSFAYLRTFELSVADRAEAAGVPRDEFWHAWRGRELHPQWLAWASSSASPGLRRWLAQPGVFHELTREFAEVDGYLRDVGATYASVLTSGATAFVGYRELSRARSELIMANVRFAKARALEFVRGGNRLKNEDAYPAALQGLIRAVDKFDFRAANKLLSYADQWITVRLGEAYEQTFLLKRPPAVKRCGARVLNARDSLMSRHGRMATVEEILAEVWRQSAVESLSAWRDSQLARGVDRQRVDAAMADSVDRIIRDLDFATEARLPCGSEPVRLVDVEQVLDYRGDPASLDAPVGDDDDSAEDSLYSMVADPESVDPTDGIGDQVRRNIDRVLVRLSGVQEKVMRYTFGVGPQGVPCPELDPTAIAARLNERPAYIRTVLSDGKRRFKELAELLFPQDVRERLGLA